MPFTPNSVRRIHTVLHKALAMAVEDGLLFRNVADGACRDLGGGQQGEDGTNGLKAWTRDELSAFLDLQRGDRLHPLWHLIAFAGLRRGEVLGLEWSAVDLDAGELSIRRARVMAAGRVVVSTPKTERSRRTVYIDPGTVAVLRNHAARQADECRKAGDAWTESGLVFTREDGQALGPRWVSRLFERAVHSHNRTRLLEDGPAAMTATGHNPPRTASYLRLGGTLRWHAARGCLRTTRARQHRHHQRHLWASLQGVAPADGGAVRGNHGARA